MYSRIWKIMGEIQVKEVREKVFIFQFDEWWEKESVYAITMNVQ